MDKVMIQFGVSRMIGTPVPEHLYRVEADSRLLYSVVLSEVTTVDFTALETNRKVFNDIWNLQIVFYESDPFYYALIFDLNEDTWHGEKNVPLLVEYCVADYRQWLGDFLFDIEFKEYIQSLIAQKSSK